MIEQSVSLASNGVVKVPGYEQLVRFGYTKNRGVYRLHVDATGEWEGLAIRCFWHVPDGKDPASSLVVDGYVDVPASVTAQPGSGCITFEGSDGTKTVTSADLRYRVSANSGTEDGTEPDPGTPAWQQLVDAVHTDATAAEQAKADAQTAASEAATSAGSASQSAQKAADSLQELKDGIAAGEFKGEPGNDGKSPVVTVTDIENGHRVSITDKDGTKTIDVLNGQTGKTGATPVLTIGTVSSGDKPSADITGTPENPVLNLMLQPGPQGPAVALDTTLTHEGEAADAKATGDAISAVKTRQNVLVGTETGNPLSVDDSFAAPLCGLTVYGRSTQDGTPSPDSPVPIVSAGDGGSMTVKVTGRNLLNIPDGSVTARGVTVTAKDGLISISGTATSSGYANLGIPPFIASGVVILSSSLASPKVKLVSATWDVVLSLGAADKMSDMATRIVFMVAEGQTYNLTGVKVQLEPGTTATAYEPYREQLLTLPTPTGLPGIPVTSGGNYTDQSGQQWVCDEVDLERGVRVQRILKVTPLSATDIFNKLANTEEVRIDNPFIRDRGRLPMLCNTFKLVPGTWGVDTPYIFSYAATGNASIAFRLPIGVYSETYFKEHPTTVYGILATPIKTPLTPAEIAAYKALTAYAPDTVVQASDGAGVKLEYQRDVNIAIKKLEDAVASMTTT